MRRAVIGLMGLAMVSIFALGAIVGGATWPDAGAQGVCATPAADGALRFEGEGDDVTEPFALKDGTAIFTLSAQGEGFINVQLIGAPGTTDLQEAYLALVEDVPYSGRAAENIYMPGSYVLAVEADGPWVVTIEQ